MATPATLASIQPCFAMHRPLSVHNSALRAQTPTQAFNKVDVARHEFALEWMADFDAYSAALEADSSYAATLSRSLSLVLEEFYAGMRSVGLSALTGEGMDDLFKVGAACVSWQDSAGGDCLPAVYVYTG
jgi:hypothetical protein